jgi:hypothetical protein
MDKLLNPFSIFKSVTMDKEKKSKEPFEFKCNKEEGLKKQIFKLEFEGHYMEPVYELEVDMSTLTKDKIYTISLDIK